MPPAEHSPLSDSLQIPGSLPGNAKSRSSPWRQWDRLLLGLIVGTGAFLRLWQAGESLWIDELHTSWVVSGALRDVLPRAAMGNQSPLYFWGMWLLVQLTGHSEWTLRLPSLLAGIALPAAVYFLANQLSALSTNGSGQDGNPSYISLAAALLVAIDPTCVFFSQEARPYAWVMLLAVVELVLLKHLVEESNAGWRLALLVNSLALFYLHYTTVIFLTGMVALLPMLVRLTGSAYRTKELLFDLLLAAVLATPGVIQLSHIFERRTNWEAFVDQPTWQQLFSEVPLAGWAVAGAIVVALAVLVPEHRRVNALGSGSASESPGSGSRRPSVFWYAVLLASILIPLVLSWAVTTLDAARIYYVRYMLALVPLAAAAACLAANWIPWRLAQVTALIALVGWQLYEGELLQLFTRDRRFLAERKEDWRGAVQYLNRHLSKTSTALVIVDSQLIEAMPTMSATESPNLSDATAYLTFPLRGIYEASVDPNIITFFPDLAHTGRIATSWDPPWGDRDLWVVIRGNEEHASQRIETLQRLAPFVVLVPHGEIRLKVDEQRAFGNVHVARLKCLPDQ